MPKAPFGLEMEDHPLKHRFAYAFGLSGVTTTMNTATCTIIRNSTLATEANAKTILVNPKNASQDVETGPLCTSMSIIRNMRIFIGMSKSNQNNKPDIMKFSITPIFGAFPEKWDVADDDSGVTVTTALGLTKGEGEEDIVPLTTNKLPAVVGDLDLPLSTVNAAEAFIADYNYSTNATMEDTVFDNDVLQSLFQHGSKNIQGALKSVMGRTRHINFDITSRSYISLSFKNFLPRAVRRINPWTYFGLLFHMPTELEIDSPFRDTTLTASKSNVGFKVIIRYDEWNAHHDNTM